MSNNVLLLQGPVGPFFRRLSKELRAHGHLVFKVNFNGGDRHFYRGPDAIDYSGTIGQWRDYLEKLIVRLQIDRIYVFGDCRSYHEVAREVAEATGTRFFVFEEGYLRPDYITLEEHGVNGHSRIRFPQALPVVSLRPELRPRHHFSRGFFYSAWYAIRYYMAASWYRRAFPHYNHHRPLNVIGEGGKWLLSLVRKLRSVPASRRFEGRVQAEMSGRYFLVPLQVHNDMQVIRHSGYPNVEAFIAELVASFARFAAPSMHLVFKHHPMDRGYRNYAVLLRDLAKRHGVSGRIHYLSDGHLPTLLKNARGTVTINSTVGLSSLHHGVPVKVMGEAIYDRKGLTYGGTLAQFWVTPGEVDMDLYHRFRRHLLDTNQLNGNFYQRAANAANATGIVWSGTLAQQHGILEAPPSRRRSIVPRLVKGSAA